MSEIDENIIIKFLSGLATAEESREILRWKNSSLENTKTFKIQIKIKKKQGGELSTK